VLSELTELATEASSEKRRQLLGRIADMFYNDGRDLVAEQEMLLFASVVTRLLRDIDADGRRTFSSIVAGNEKTPHAVALSLANDDADIAAPVLQRSPQLTEDDLVEITTSRTMEHRLAISRRANITVRVTDALIDFGEVEVMHSLVENRTASMSERGFNVIADRSLTSASLREKICLRGDVPATAARKLLPFLDDADRAKMEALIAANGGAVDELVREALPESSAERSDRAKRRLHIKALAAQIDGGTASLDGMLASVIAERDPFDVALLLSELTLLPEKQMVNAMVLRLSEPLMLTCKALGAGADVFVLANGLRCETAKMAADAESRLREVYGKLDAASAQRAMRFVNVRAKLSKTG